MWRKSYIQGLWDPSGSTQIQAAQSLRLQPAAMFPVEAPEARIISVSVYAYRRQLSFRVDRIQGRWEEAINETRLIAGVIIPRPTVKRLKFSFGNTAE